jgi:hypothetical protein
VKKVVLERAALGATIEDESGMNSSSSSGDLPFGAPPCTSEISEGFSDHRNIQPVSDTPPFPRPTLVQHRPLTDISPLQDLPSQNRCCGALKQYPSLLLSLPLRTMLLLDLEQRRVDDAFDDCPRPAV